MAAITPSTNLKLLKCPLTLDEKNQLTFNSAADQYNYFNSLPKKEVDDFSYQRENGIIRFEAEIDTILEYNYVMYQNENYSNKWFYAFITNMRYINDNMTEISINTDSFQTYQFNITYKSSFIEREHVNNDSIGANTVPENLEIGDYIDQDIDTTERNSFNFLLDNTYVVIGTPDPGLNGFNPGLQRRYNGLYGSLTYLFFPFPADAETYTFLCDAKFPENPIYEVFVAPRYLCSSNVQFTNYSETIGGKTYEFQYSEVDQEAYESLIQNSSLSKIDHLDSNYYPRNRKLLTSPYVYFLVSNNAGSTADYKYEYFSGNNCSFQITGSICVGCSIKLQPINYNYKSSINNLFSLDAGKLPTCSWTNDTYTNWLTANSVNNAVGVGAGIVGIAAGTAMIASGAGAPMGVGLLASGVGSVYNTLKSNYEHSLAPLQSKGGSNMGNYNYSARLSFSVYRKSIKTEFARIIDDYFDAYGYAIHQTKVPNITGRANWNYVKTIGANILGNIPQADLQSIKNMFDAGITLWHNPSTFLDYSQNNGII